MWKAALDFLKRILAVTADIKQTKDELIEYRREVKDQQLRIQQLVEHIIALERVVETQSLEIKHVVERYEDKQMIQQLRYELEQMQVQKELPAPPLRSTEIDQ